MSYWALEVQFAVLQTVIFYIPSCDGRSLGCQLTDGWDSRGSSLQANGCDKSHAVFAHVAVLYFAACLCLRLLERIFNPLTHIRIWQRCGHHATKLYRTCVTCLCAEQTFFSIKLEFCVSFVCVHRGDLPESHRSLVVTRWSQAGICHHQWHSGAQDGDSHVHKRTVSQRTGVPLP